MVAALARHRMRAGVGEAERIAVRLGARDLLGADAAAAADAVLDDQLLTQALTELLRDQAGDGVRAAAGGERDDEADRPLRPARVGGLCMRRGRPKASREQHQDQASHEVGLPCRMCRPES